MSDVKYTMVDTGELDTDHWGVHINSGEFADNIFKFTVVKFEEEEDENGDIHVSFEYDVLDPPFPYEGDKLTRFNETLGWILNDLLVNAIEDYDGKTRNTDTQESDIQRTVYEEGIPIP
jgi:hypothetical protein